MIRAIQVHYPIGGAYIADTAAHTPPTDKRIVGIHALTDCVISTATGNISGIAAVTLKATDTIHGEFTSVTLTSGTAILYYDRV